MSGARETALALRLALRELRGGLRGFGVFLACLFLGTFSVSAVGSFSAAARGGLLSDARTLLGGDLELHLHHQEIDEVQRDFLATRGKLSEVVEMRAMARSPENGRRLLVELKAVDEVYPLFGSVGADPPQPLADALGRRGDTYGALVERSLAGRLGLAPGGTMLVGEARVRVSGVLTAEPDRTLSGAFTFGPRLLMSREGLAATGLVGPGSLVSYGYRLKLPDGVEPDALERELPDRFPEAGWRVRTYHKAAPRVEFFLDRLTTNLTLLGLTALLVGGLGVAGGVRGYLERKTFHIAAMKCVGATARLIFMTYSAQILLLGAVGAMFGLAAGALVPYLVVWLAGEAVPIPLKTGIFPSPLALAALFGLLTAVAFSLVSLGMACRVRPAVLFRGYAGAAREQPGRAIRGAVGLTFLLLGGLAVAANPDRRLALWFLAGTAGCFLLFRLLSMLLILAAARLPRSRNPSIALGVANIHRPGSPSASALFSLGFGLTALVMVALVQANLNALVSEDLPKDAPAYFFIDIQTDQVAEFDALVKASPGVTRLNRFPTLRGRITSIAGVPVEQATVAPEVAWAVRGDRYLSYAGARPAGTEVVAGSWWPEDYQGPPLLSLSADLAKGFGVGVGDTITVNVLGHEITATIANLRHVDWSTMQLNFALLFAPGALEAAPQTHMAAAHVPPTGEDALLRGVTDTFANISAIGVREMLANVSNALARIGLAFRLMAAVTLAAGLLVLSGAVSADQHRRIHDAVIFKVCGATRRNILAVYLTEFTLVGAAAGFVSAAAGSLAAWGIVTHLMRSRFVMFPGVVAVTVALGAGVALCLGLAGTWRALGQRPAGYLREG